MAAPCTQLYRGGLALVVQQGTAAPARRHGGDLAGRQALDPLIFETVGSHGIQEIQDA